MISPEWIRVGLTVLGGALAGGLTNSVAVWMLFHPYRPPKIGPLRLTFLHGAIPKNQPRLARAVGRTVGTRLLNEEDLGRLFSSDEFRGAFEGRLEAGIDDLLSTDRGSLRSLIPEDLALEVDPLLDDLADTLAGRVADWAAADAFAEAFERELGRLLDAVADRPVGDVLTPARESALVEAVEGWLDDAIERGDLQSVVEGYLERGAETLLTPERSLESLLPLGLSSSLERALATYLPVVVQRLGRLLEDPVARVKVESALQDLFRRLVRDLRFHQRVVARFVVTDETLDRVLTTVQEEGAQRVSEMLQEPDLQRALARGINEAMADLLRRPVTEVLGGAEDSNMVQARVTLSTWVLGIARDPETRAFLSDRLRGGLSKVSEATWGDVLRRISVPRVRAHLLEALRGEAGQKMTRDAARTLLGKLMDRPIGRPADWLPAGSSRRIRGALSPVIWRWLQGQTPSIVRAMDVGRRVEEKVLQFPTEELEALVRRITERELRLIVRLGYVLGAMIGGILMAVQVLVP